MKRILSILIENKPGALARVVGLFHQRGYNIETLNVGPVFDGTYSRMTVTTRGSENDVEQITKQINDIAFFINKTIPLIYRQNLFLNSLLNERKNAPLLHHL